MSGKGILFSTLMVQKLVVEKVKTHTRRTSGLEKLNKNPEDWKLMPQVSADGAYRFYSMKWDESVWCKPRYFKGDILYIKETWKIGAYKYNDKAVIEHKAGGFKIVAWNNWLEKNTKYGGSNVGDDKWRSSMFQFKWATRPNRYEVISVNPHRVQTITDNEAKLEGFSSRQEFGDYLDKMNPKTKPFANNWWVFDYGIKEIEVKY